MFDPRTAAYLAGAAANGRGCYAASSAVASKRWNCRSRTSTYRSPPRPCRQRVIASKGNWSRSIYSSL